MAAPGTKKKAASVKTSGGRISIGEAELAQESMEKKESKTASSGQNRPSVAQLRGQINKSAGYEVAFDLQQENPSDVIDWIGTGSRWLDSIICKGKIGGVPAGKIVEIAGLSSTGKSYLACQIAKNAQQKGYLVVYFDSESAIDSHFMANIGINLEELIYVQAKSVEFVLEQIESFIDQGMDKILFIWDSLALTPCETEIEGSFDPSTSMAVTPRILSRGFKKITQKIANNHCTLLVLNQLKTNITRSTAEALTTPYVTPGGLAPTYAYSLRIWLTGRKAKDSFVYDSNGFRIGSEVKAKIEKSRFGTLGRECSFKILWGAEDAIIQDEESWLPALMSIGKNDRLELNGSWYKLHFSDGTEVKFQSKDWIEKLKEPKFHSEVISLMDDLLIHRFAAKQGNAANYYSLDDDGDEKISDGTE